MTSDEADETPVPRALELLWRGRVRRAVRAGLTRERIVAAAIDLGRHLGLAALSMARLAERLGCGTIVALTAMSPNKDELVVFMLSEAPAPPPARRRRELA